jgi:hypothetical protein
MLNYLHFKTLYSRNIILAPYFLLTFSITKLAVVLVWILLVFSTVTNSNVSRLIPFDKVCHSCKQCLEISDVFNKYNIPFVDTFSFLILWTYIIIMFLELLYCLGLNFSLVPVLVVLVLALVWLSLCTLLVLECYRPLAVGKNLNEGIQFNSIIIIKLI